MADAGIVHMFIHPGVLRGLHVYGNSENWVPYQDECLTFQRELSNVHDQFAVAGQTDLHGRQAVTVGHVPREISRFVWYALQHGALIRAKVTDPNPKRSPLVQGGLEIPLEWTISWDDFNKLEILRQKMINIAFDSYTDESSQILRDMGIAEDDDDQSNNSETDGEVDGRDDENEEIISLFLVRRNRE